MKCSKCDHQNKEGVSYCVQCGDFMGNTCPNCKERAETGDVYCGSCGRKLNPHGTDRTPRDRRVEEKAEKDSKDLTYEFATFLRGTKQTLQYWGWALLGILLVIGAIIGFGSWGPVMNKAIDRAEKMVEKEVEARVREKVRERVDERMRDVKKDKAYVNLRIARLLYSTHREFVTEEEYTRTDYLDDIRYWIAKAEEQYEDLQTDYPTNTEFNFELGRIYYNYPFLYGTEDKINYGKAIQFFEDALLFYDDEQKKKGWDKEAYYYLGNIYYDLWKKNEREEYQQKSIEYFRSALQEKPGKLDDKFRFCAEKMRAELKGGEECDFTPKQRIFTGCRPPPY